MYDTDFQSQTNKKKISVPVYLIVLFLSTATLSAQRGPFTSDSIPLVEDEVVFTYPIKGELSKEEIYTRIHYFLDRELDPHTGLFLKNNSDSLVCQVVDYIEVESSLLYVLGMYMTYDLKFVFNDGICNVTVSHISFMEKSHFEQQEKTSRDLNFSLFTGKDIMIDQSYKQLLRRDVSPRITESAIKRLNEIISGLRDYLVD